VVEIPALFKLVYISFTVIMSEEQGVASSEEEVLEEEAESMYVLQLRSRCMQI
jgi:hypothetical protein